jgi:hypothetical protein
MEVAYRLPVPGYQVHVQTHRLEGEVVGELLSQTMVKAGQDGSVLADSTDPIQRRVYGLRSASLYIKDSVIRVAAEKEAVIQSLPLGASEVMSSSVAPHNLARAVRFWIEDDGEAVLSEQPGGRVMVTLARKRVRTFLIDSMDWTLLEWSETSGKISVVSQVTEFQPGLLAKARFPRRVRMTATHLDGSQPPFVSQVTFSEPVATSFAPEETQWWTYSATAVSADGSARFGPGNVPLPPAASATPTDADTVPSAEKLDMKMTESGKIVPVAPDHARNILFVLGMILFMVAGFVYWRQRYSSL